MWIDSILAHILSRTQMYSEATVTFEFLKLQFSKILWIEFANFAFD